MVQLQRSQNLFVRSIYFLYLFIILLQSCYKPRHEHENNSLPEFDILLHQSRNLQKVTCNFRDSTCTMRMTNIAKTIGIRFEFILLRGNAEEKFITCTFSGMPAGMIFKPSSFTAGLSSTIWPDLNATKITRGTYPLTFTVKSATYGTEVFTLKLLIE